MISSRERGAVAPQEAPDEPEHMNEEDIPVDPNQGGLNVDPNNFWKRLDEEDDTLPGFDPKTGKLT